MRTLAIAALALALSGCTAMKATAPDSIKPAVEAGDALAGAACVAYDATASEYPDSWATVIAAACAIQRNTFASMPAPPRTKALDLACIYVGPEVFTATPDMAWAYSEAC